MALNRKTKIDPELLRQIDSVGAGTDSIQAVFSLHLPLKKLIEPGVVEETAQQVLRRAAQDSGSSPRNVNIFKNLGSFAVSADASLIRKIIDDPDIATAVANKQPEPTNKSKAKKNLP